MAATGGNLGPSVYLTGTYGNSICASITTPSMMLGAGSTLTFWSKYQIENSWDKGVVEISSDGGIDLGQGTGELPRKLDQHHRRLRSADRQRTSRAPGTHLDRVQRLAGDLGRTRRDAALALVDRHQRNLPGWWVDDIAITNVMVPSDCDSEPPLFADDFEDGTTMGWDRTEP